MNEQRFKYCLRQFFLKLNVFKENPAGEHELRRQRWSTRLYIPILLLAMLILLVYTIFQVESIQIQIENPSLRTYTDLYKRYTNVKCPCNDISIEHKEFLQLSPLFHQVCSSDLISEEWIDFLFDKQTTTLRYAADFRTTAFNQFQLLRELCQLSVIAIDDGLETLYQSQLISGELLDQDLFNAQVEADILAFQTITNSDFLRSLMFMRSFMAGNEFLPAVETDYTLVIEFQNINNLPGATILTNYFTESDGSSCGCDTYFSCHISAGFYNFDRFDSGGRFDLTEVFPQIFVDGWKVGCWPIESLLISTLESFYNQTIFNQIIFNVNSSTAPNRFTALNISANSNFTPNSTIEILVNQLFVEKWLKTLNYSSYFAQCQPQYCQYIINHRPEFIYIIISLLGLYGGLSAVLHLIIPYIVNFFLKWIEQRSIAAVDQTIRPKRTLSQWIKKISNTLFHLNLYRSPLQMEPIDIAHQLWSTRVYIGLICLCVLILTLYSSVSMGTRVIQIDNPSLNTVEQLEKQGYSLICPCEQLSINYADLFELTPAYHQVCSSVFITSEWIAYLNDITGHSGISYADTDFRATSSSSFQILNSMCSLSNQTVLNALFQLGQTQLITNQLLQVDLFTNQINSIIEYFKVTLPNNLLRLVQLIRNITHINQFISGGDGNFRVNYYTDKQSSMTLAILKIFGFTSPASDGIPDCLCAYDISCGTNSVLYNYDKKGNPTDVYYTLPDFYMRCFPIESLFPSTLECFYDNNPCFDIINNVSSKIMKNFTRLNSSQPSRFPINVTINDLLEALFLESWLTTLYYPNYFDKCQPIYCSYTIIQRRTPLEIVTTITGLIGGLSTILKFLSPYIVAGLFYLIHRYQHRYLTNNTEPQQNRRNINIWTRVINLLRNVRDIIRNLNIFEDVNNPSLNENEIHIKRQATRVYIALLSLTILIFVTYTSLMYHNNQITENISSLDSLIHFQNLHNDTFIDCPCTKLSIVQSAFYQMKPVFHDVCSSDFVNNQWIYLLFDYYRYLPPLPTNAFTFSGTAFTYFQAMSLMCHLAIQAVIDARDLFLATSVVTSQMPNFHLFDSNTNSTLDDFQSTLSNNFIHNLDMFRGFVQGNGLVSVYSTNWNLFLPNLTIDNTIYMKSQSYGECDCATSSSCIQNSTPYLPGYVVGCLPLESFLRSTFECLYDQLCVNQMSSYVESSYFPTALNRTNSRFTVNTSVNIIVEEMFIETWLFNKSYENFFQECQPISCSYISSERYNLIYVITTLLGLYGGISILLKLLVPFIMRQLYQCINRFRRRRNRQVMPIDSHY